MKKFLYLFLFFTQIFCFNFVFADSPDLKTVRVGIYNNNPKIYKDADGSIKGFWADITNYIAQKENWNLVYVYGTWDEGLARLKNNEIDLMVDVAVSEERKNIYDFNKESAFLSWSIVYTKKDFDIKSFKDLEGKNIAIMESSVHYTAPLGLKNVLSSFGVNSKIIDVKNMDEVFKLLDTNQADAGVVNWNFGISNEKNFNVVRTGLIFNPSELNYAMPKDGVKNSYLTSVIDFHLREIKNDSASIYYKSISTNFSKALGQIEVQVMPSWVRLFLIISGIVLVVIIATLLLMRQYQRTLQREIDSKVHEIKESEEKYSAVVNQAQDGIVIIQDQIIKYANNAISIIGYTNEEVLGKPFIKLVAPEEQSRVIENYKKRTAGEKVDSVYETKLSHKNGSIVDVEFSSGIIKYGNMPADLVMVRDITEKKKEEEKITQLERAKSEFVSIAAHQLRTPIAAIKAASGFVLEEDTRNLTESQMEFLDIVNKGSEQMNELVDFLLKISRAEAGKVKFALSPINLEEVTSVILANFKEEINRKSITIKINKNPDLIPHVFMDKNALTQVISNLISNAINYSPEKSEIILSMVWTENTVEYSVKDSGIGIPKTEQSKIFEKFYRASNAQNSVKTGTGLGLALAMSLVSAWGGKIWFDSEENKGTIFHVTIPVIGKKEVQGEII